MNYMDPMKLLEKVAHDVHNVGFQKCVFIFQHMGLGDHIVANGLTREIIKNEEDVVYFFMPVKHRNLGTIRKMYSDIPNLVLIPVNGNWNEIYNLDFMKVCYKIYQIGNYMTRVDWDLAFYDNHGVPFEKRWTSFKINRDYQAEKELEQKVNPSDEPFILVHDSTSWATLPLQLRNDIKIIRVTPITDCITDWCGLIEKAQEIHCVDSSFIHLCTSFSKYGTFHDFSGTNLKDYFHGVFVMPDTWEVKKYSNIF